jgi:hypothetical protein
MQENWEDSSQEIDPHPDDRGEELRDVQRRGSTIEVSRSAMLGRWDIEASEAVLHASAR